MKLHEMSKKVGKGGKLSALFGRCAMTRRVCVAARPESASYRMGYSAACFCAAACALAAAVAFGETETVKSHLNDGSVFFRPNIGTSGLGNFPHQNLIVGRTGSGNTWYMYNGIAFFRLPMRTMTAASWVFPSCQNGTISAANADMWSLGWQSSPSIANSWCLGVDNDTRILLNNRKPDKLIDNWIPAGTSFSGKTVSDELILDYYGLLLNRGAGTNDYVVLRINPDADYGTAGTNESAAQFRITAADGPDGSIASSPARALYTYHDFTASPDASRFSEDQQASEGYLSVTARWAQCASPEGVSMPYIAYAGATNGSMRSLIFLLPLPDATCSNSWLTLNVAPFASCRVPAGVNLDLWGLGVVTNKTNVDMLLEENVHLAADEDAATHLGGRTPVKLVDNFVSGGSVLTPGQTLRLRARQQRDILRWINNQIVFSAESGKGRDGWLVFRLNPDANVSSSDWGVGIGTVATPEIPSRFEAQRYVTWKQILYNPSFESGNGYWTRAVNKFYLDVVSTDSARTGGKAMKFAVSATEESPITSDANNANFSQTVDVSAYRGHRYVAKASYKNPSEDPMTTGQGAEVRLYNKISTSQNSLWSLSVLSPTGAKDTWVDFTRNGVFPANMGSAILQGILRSGTTQGQTSASGSCWADDFELWVEEFHQIPDEEGGFTIMFK